MFKMPKGMETSMQEDERMKRIDEQFNDEENEESEDLTEEYRMSPKTYDRYLIK